MEKGAFRRIAAPFIRDTARRATLPRPRETMRPSIYRMKTRAGGETWTEMRVALQRATRPTVSETEGGGMRLCRAPNWTGSLEEILRG